MSPFTDRCNFICWFNDAELIAAAVTQERRAGCVRDDDFTEETAFMPLLRQRIKRLSPPPTLQYSTLHELALSLSLSIFSLFMSVLRMHIQRRDLARTEHEVVNFPPT